MATKDMLGTAVRKLVTLPAATLGLVCDLLEKLADPKWVEATKRFLRRENPWPEPVQGVFQGIDALIRQSGLTKVDDWIIDEHAPDYQYPNSEAEVEYLNLGYQNQADRAIEDMERRGYRPAEDPEVLRHSIKHPDQLVEGKPVVVLGSAWHSNNGCEVLVLVRNGASRYVKLLWWFDVRGSNCLYAAVKMS